MGGPLTFVNWEQRAVGKHIPTADSARPNATRSPGQLAQDATVVVQYLRRTFGVQEVVAMGHSYGSSIGTWLAQMHPEWVSACVDVGQASNQDDGRSPTTTSCSMRGQSTTSSSSASSSRSPGTRLPIACRPTARWS